MMEAQTLCISFFVKLPNNILSHSKTRASQKYLKTTKFTQFKPLDPFLAKINSCFRYVAFTGKTEVEGER